MAMRLKRPPATHVPRRMRQGGTAVTPVYEPGPIVSGVLAVFRVLGSVVIDALRLLGWILRALLGALHWH